MDQEKIGIFIKEIRVKNKMTQLELADKLGVSFQAVSKWERGICLPDIYILREISKIFDVSISDILDGETEELFKNNKNKINKNNLYYILGVIFLVVIIILAMFVKDRDDFEFKQISTSCDNFNITGSMAYNKDKTSLYISSIEFCGTDDNVIYENIKCTLYEEHDDVHNVISSCDPSGDISLEEYLRDVKISVDDYELSCDNMFDSELYLEINALLESNKEVVYKIPISLLENSCVK